MAFIRKLLTLLRPAPETPEEIEAELESDRVQEQLQTVRLSQRSAAGENYQSGRGTKP
jgi:hypothetical protein